MHSKVGELRMPREQSSDPGETSHDSTGRRESSERSVPREPAPALLTSLQGAGRCHLRTPRLTPVTVQKQQNQQVVISKSCTYQRDSLQTGCIQTQARMRPRGILRKQLIQCAGSECLFLTVMADNMRIFLNEKEFVSGFLCSKCEEGFQFRL